MESINNNSISINIPNYSGPLYVLLDLAKSQKVNLNDISITKLADQFLIYIKATKNLNLETASEFLLMATWLAYLKSKLLLPFERVDEARGNKGGSGLGLTIADRIVKAHDGKLELINRSEGGLDVKITIPIITA